MSDEDESLRIQRELLEIEREKLAREKARDERLTQAAAKSQAETIAGRRNAAWGCSGCLFVFIGPPILIIIMAYIVSVLHLK